MEPLPYDKTFSSSENLVAWVDQYADSKGHGIQSKEKSGSMIEIRYRNWISTEEAVFSQQLELGEAISQGLRYAIPHTSTSTENCPFQCVGIERDSEWLLVVVDAAHNHESRLSLSQIPTKLLEFMQKEMNDSSLDHMFHNIKEEFKSYHLTIQQVGTVHHSLVNRERNKFLDPYWMRLIHCLEELHCFRIMRPSISLPQSQLFFSHRSSQSLLAHHSRVNILELTTPQNQMDISILEFSAISGTGVQFHVASAIMSKARDPDYNWPLQQLKELYEGMSLEAPDTFLLNITPNIMSSLREVFPSTNILISPLRICKLILLELGPHIADQRWLDYFEEKVQECIFSTSSADYESRWDKIGTKLRRSGLEDLHNSITQRYASFKSNFLLFRTNTCVHYGLLTSSDREPQIGETASLSEYLVGPVYNMDMRINGYRDHLEFSIRKSFQKNELSKLLRHDTPLFPIFEQIRGKITEKGIEMAAEELIKIMSIFVSSDPYPACDDGCVEQKVLSLGIPCRHRMVSIERENRYLIADDFSTQWHVHNYDPTPPNTHDLEPSRYTIPEVVGMAQLPQLISLMYEADNTGRNVRLLQEEVKRLSGLSDIIDPPSSIPCSPDSSPEFHTPVGTDDADSTHDLEHTDDEYPCSYEEDLEHIIL